MAGSDGCGEQRHRLLGELLALRDPLGGRQVLRRHAMVLRLGTIDLLPLGLVARG
jgi:hypothetical protein